VKTLAPTAEVVKNRHIETVTMRSTRRDVVFSGRVSLNEDSMGEPWRKVKTGIMDLWKRKKYIERDTGKSTPTAAAHTNKAGTSRVILKQSKRSGISY
jgi:hypothetical protein